MDVVLRLTDAERDRIDQQVLAAAPRRAIKAEMCKSKAGRKLWKLYWERTLDDATDTIGPTDGLIRLYEDDTNAN